MIYYLIRRSFESLIVLVVLSFIVYALMALMPGDPVDLMCASNPKCTPENLALMKKQLGLDRPLVERYFKWLIQFIGGDFGYSRTYKIPVMDLLWPRFINTMILAGLVILVSTLIAIPLGVFSGTHKNSWLDSFATLFSFAGISIPSFWLGLMLMLIFSVTLHWLPASGVETIGAQKSGFGYLLDRLTYLILPVTSLSLQTIAEWARYTRSSVSDVLGMDFMRTAKAKGLTKKRILWVHGFRNAVIPVVTVIAMSFSSLFSGAPITETIFSYQGMGKLIYDSISGNDFNVAMVTFIIGCVAVLSLNLLSDFLYGVLDPRIRYE